MKPSRQNMALLSQWQKLHGDAAERFMRELERENPDAAAALRAMAAMPSSFLENPPLAEFRAAMDAAVHREEQPPEIDGLTVGALLGCGGMGRVYRATQTGPVRRDVAVKIMGTLDNPAARARFEREYLAQARLNHHHIAQLYDVGCSRDNRSFILMEYVPGDTIVAWFGEHEGTIDDRLSLFLQLCDAVAHAHQRGILHRDLKPGNVLVTEKNGPMVKVIDFGIARELVGTEGTDHLLTAPHTQPGTPAYMSPEQLRGDVVDTRTDIYSMGVMLYELLTGTRPYVETEAQRAAHLKAVSEGRAPRPSKRRPGAGIAYDLDLITLKALAADPDDRYGTVAEFAADLRRLRRHEPVAARKGNMWYRLGRFYRRRRVAVVSAGLLLVAAAFVGTAYVRQMQARLAAETAKARLFDFLEEAFVLEDPRFDPVDARLLERISRLFHQLRRDRPDPLDLALLQRFYGKMLSANGYYTEAYCELSEALAVLGGADAHPRETIGAIESLALVCERLGYRGEAVGYHLRLMAMAEPDTRLAFYALRGLAEIVAEDHQEGAAAMFHEAAQGFLDLGYEEPAMSALRGFLENDPSLSAAHHRQLVNAILQSQTDLLGPDSPTVLQTRLTFMTEPNQEQLTRLITTIDQNVGPTHYLSLKAHMAWLTWQKDHGRSNALDLEAGRLLDLARDGLGESHPYAWFFESFLAREDGDRDMQRALWEDLLRRAEGTGVSAAAVDAVTINLGNAYLAVRPRATLGLLLPRLAHMSARDPRRPYARITVAEAYHALGENTTAAAYLDALCLEDGPADGLDAATHAFARRLRARLDPL